MRTISNTVCVTCVVIGSLAKRASKLSLSEAIAGRFTGVQTSSTPEALGERPLRRLHGVRKRRTPQPDVKIVGNRNFIPPPSPFASRSEWKGGRFAKEGGGHQRRSLSVHSPKYRQMISKQPGGPPGCEPRWSHKPRPTALLYFPLCGGVFFCLQRGLFGRALLLQFPLVWRRGRY